MRTRLLALVLLLPGLAMGQAVERGPRSGFRPAHGAISSGDGAKSESVPFRTAACVATGAIVGTKGETLTFSRAGTKACTGVGTCQANQLCDDTTGAEIAAGDFARVATPAWLSTERRWCMGGTYTAIFYTGSSDVYVGANVGTLNAANSAHFIGNRNGSLTFTAVDAAVTAKSSANSDVVPYFPQNVASTHEVAGCLDKGAGTVTLWLDGWAQTKGTGLGTFGTFGAYTALGTASTQLYPVTGGISGWYFCTGTNPMAQGCGHKYRVNPYLLVCLGDSLTQFGSPASCQTTGTTLGAPWRYINDGVGGDTALNMLSRWQTRARFMPKYLRVLAGINDIVADATAAQVEARLEAIYASARSYGVTVIPVTITPCVGHASCTAPRMTIRQTVNTWIKAKAVEMGTVAIDLATALDDGNGALSTTACGGGTCDQGDHLHFSQAGYDYASTFDVAAINNTACSGGAIAAACVCGSLVAGTGYCCSGTWQAGACP